LEAIVYPHIKQIQDTYILAWAYINREREEKNVLIQTMKKHWVYEPDRASINAYSENRLFFPVDQCAVMGRQWDLKPSSSEFESHLETSSCIIMGTWFNFSP